VKARTTIWLVLALSHVALGVLASLTGGGPLGELVAGSVYLPLNVFEKLDVRVYQPSSFFLPPPTILGWLIVCALWLAVYWFVAGVLARLIVGRRRVA
jgi:hypothetical protein